MPLNLPGLWDKLFVTPFRKVLVVPGVRVLVQAVVNYVRHQSGNQAGSVAFSMVLSMFPLLILVSAAAAFVGQLGEAAGLARRVVGYTPPLVQTALKPVIEQILGRRNEALLAIGLVATIWTASSGMQAVRTALNRAYGVDQGLSFWKARIKVTVFTLVIGSAAVALFGSVIVMPYIWEMLRTETGVGQEVPWVRDSVRYGVAFAVLTVLYALLYGWLPDLTQRLRTVVPGALMGAGLWVGAAALLSHTLQSTGKLLLVYGSFAGLVATLVFLYVSAATLIFGAEVNGVLRDKNEDRLAAERTKPG